MINGKSSFFCLCTAKRGSSFDSHFLHLNFRDRLIAAISLSGGNQIHHIQSVGYASEDRIAWRQRVVGVHDKKLRTVCVWTSVGHGHRAFFVTSLIEG